jgi:hypothetical protein
VPRDALPDQGRQSDYRFLRDDQGKIEGLWLRKPEDAKNKNLVIALLHKIPPDVLGARFRPRRNTIDDEGGSLVMFHRPFEHVRVHKRIFKSVFRMVRRILRGQACQRCGIKLITHEQFCRRAKGLLSWPIDAETGLPKLPPPQFMGTRELAAYNRFKKLRPAYDQIENKKGYVCSHCGAIYCCKCLFEEGKAGRSGGVLCFSCEGRMSRW